ncbi:MAG: hypothetical protein F6K31_03130 [Symploca sp. SIO2G7]|nr:hypothetical protein [Symploca sp. SIO2G7]
MKNLLPLERVDALPEITFDVRSRRWRYRDSRQFASIEAVRTQAERYASEEKQALVKLASNYLEGRIDLQQLQQQAARHIKHIHLAQMIIGLDKQSDLTPNKFLLVARNLKQQYHSGKDSLTGERFGIKHLATDIADGKVSPAQLTNRLRMFGESGKVTYWGTKSAIASDNGIKEARRILGDAEHCRHCPSYAALGWVPLSELILPTQQCECRTNCKCTVEFRTSREDACRVPLRDEKGRFAGCAVGGGNSGSGGGGGGSGTNTRELQRELRAEIDRERRKRRSTGQIRNEPSTRELQRELRAEIDRERRRIARGFVASSGIVLKPTAPSKTTPQKAPKNTPVVAKKPRKKRLPTLRPAGNPNHFQVTGDKIEIWRGTEHAKFDPTYRTRRERNHEYGVNHDGQRLVLNNHKDVIVLQGETVKGVPSYYPKLREMPAQSLFDGLAKTMSYVEDKNAPPAPDWKPTFHGKIDKKYVRSKKKPGDYNGMQIHHVDQWAKAKFDDINGRLDRKEISLEQAKTEMRALLTPDPNNKRTGYHISLEQQRDRNLVVLPSGTEVNDEESLQENFSSDTTHAATSICRRVNSACAIALKRKS